MTLESTTNINRYVGNGSATEFAFSFKVWEPDQVAVVVGNGETEQDVTASCSIVLTDTGGTVTFSDAPADGTVIVIRRSMPYTQEDNYTNGTRFDAEEIEDRLDQDCAERQDLKLDVERALKVPLTSSESGDGFISAIFQARDDAQEALDAIGGAEEVMQARDDVVEAMQTAGDVTGATRIASSSGGTTLRSLSDRCADWVNLKDFGAVGDGSTSDSTAWNTFQTACASGGLGYIPSGSYKLSNSDTRNFESGCIGNGYRDANANFQDYDEPAYKRTIIRQSDEFTADGTSRSTIVNSLTPQVKLHTKFTLDNSVISGQGVAGYQRGIGISVTAEGNGTHPYGDDTKFCNASLIGARVINKFAGQFGMNGVYVEVHDVSHATNANIATKGASKVCGVASQSHRNARYADGGYQIGMETMTYWHSISGVSETVYQNKDDHTFTSWVCGIHCTGSSSAQPLTDAILINCGSVASQGSYGFWNGIVLGSTCWNINGVTAGPAGTVGINLASWSSAKHAETGIKFNAATRHLWFKSGAKIQSPYTRFLNSGGECIVEAMANTGTYPQFVLSNGDASGASPSPTALGKLYAQNTGLVLKSEVSGSGVYVAAVSGSTTTSYIFNSTRLAPTTHNACALGADGARWSDIYCVTGGIHDSDERLKQDIEGVSDALLDAWAGVAWKTYRFRDAVAQKGEAARSHVGVIAQDVDAAFEAAGLDASEYGFFCHDAWEDQYEETQVKEADAVLDENGRVIEPERWRTERTIAVPAGDRFAMRYEEALCLEAAYLRREIARIKAHLSMQE